MFKSVHIPKIITIIVSLSIFGCFDKPDEFISPTWDTELHVPITSEVFELLEIVEKDSSLLKSSEDPSKDRKSVL